MIQTKLLLIGGFTLISTLEQGYALANPPLTLPEHIEHFPAFKFAQQPNPNEDRFLQPTPEPVPSEPAETEPVLPTREEPIQPPPSEPTETTINVSSIEVVGSTVFGAEEFNPIIEPLEGRTVTIQELQNATDAIAQLYRDAGYFTSTAILPQQEVTDGVVTIQVIEGRLAEIQIDGTERLKPSYIRKRIQSATSTPLRVDELEEQLRLLRTNPLFDTLNATLEAGAEAGESILVVQVEEANPFYGNVSIDNYSPPSIGSERLGFQLGYRNLIGIGDTLSGAYYRSTTGGSDLFDFSYRVPLNAKDGTLQLRTVIDRNEITEEPFDALNIEGETELYEVSFRQPLIRTLREEFALSLGFSYRDGQTFIFDRLPTPFGIGPDEDGVSRTSVFRFGQDYLKRDIQGAWSLRSQFSIGTGLFDATTNDSPIPDSRFFSWLGQVQRVQILGENHLLIIDANLQLTPDSLLASEQFVIGGGQTLRGYRQNARSGDNGFRFSVEDRITLERNQNGLPTFQLAPFVDLGAVWNHPDNPNDQPDQTFLASVGLGLLWEPIPNLNLRLDYGIPFVDLDDRGENAQDEGFHFSVSYQF
ncbi:MULTISPECIES: ShlB/FhaC/HecB family hemolysin secretion/activation protein [unclassified Coleofasciculus]|uniref:ShlB/FhaC/HecB family hemolysin secretion/activation protein n=1 Tax=unclassified Coleofasciculus TaxID=2692782 RepID=UPI00187DE1AB|nr:MULTISPECIES: ShlB/FhaC/HecB family hemolysin secretion/activation protein [unclassified Coleofasciculus]MBE9127780.1 ShlB/FhaC/HecB family hemolysin secretion/activation protein [Coleofasciculus sp. LEGE 07081]MBE9148585.1 ShlB/FhaC/HecB family hemolysin secretion/activation protein [Coleofasciculus sp. LEGE 07092]